MNWLRISRRRNPLFLNYIVLIALCGFALLPIYVLGINTFKTRAEIGQDSFAWPAKWNFDNLTQAWTQGNFGTTMTNSLILVIFTVFSIMVLGGLAAYSLARLDPPGSNVFIVYMLTLSSIPIWIYIIPLFILYKNLGLLDTRQGLVLLYIALNSPFAIFLLRSFMLNLPKELEDAARVDGANEIQVLTQVVAPLVWSGFLTVGLVVALAVWNEFALAYVFISNDALLPVTTSYFRFRQRFGQDWALTSAGAFIMILPVIIIFLSLQRRFIEGLTQGGVRG
jgi:raffinose/stachyose/melibiose transport system permease protein